MIFNCAGRKSPGSRATRILRVSTRATSPRRRSWKTSTKAPRNSLPNARSISSTKMAELYLKQMALGPMQNYVYLVGDPATKQAAVVDPAWNVPAILNQVKADGYRLTHVLLSHGHYDHINGVEDVVEKTDATVCGYKSEIEEFIVEGMGGMVIPKSSLKKTDTNSSVKVGSLEIRMIHTPGHTPGSQCLWIQQGGSGGPVLLTGDTLFVGTIGRCDLPYSSPQD